MVSTKKTGGVANAHEKLIKHFNSDNEMSATESDLQAVSRTICKMPGRTERVTVQQTMDVLFSIADSKLEDDHSKKVLENLRKHVAQIEEDLYRPKPRFIDAFFFPNKDNVHKLARYIKMAKKSLLICVFNLTNDDLANAIKERYEAGVDVRIVTDDECIKNKGNDCQWLANQGIPVRTDDSEQYHMHNKFMVVDTDFLLTGSFNWTFQAGSHNQENLLVVDHPFYIEKYTSEFDKLWREFDRNKVQQKEDYSARKIQNSYKKKQHYQKAKNYNSEKDDKLPAAQAKSAAGFEFKPW